MADYTTNFFSTGLVVVKIRPANAVILNQKPAHTCVFMKLTEGISGPETL
jgi:hypothetical protein